jgi:UDP-glucuronate 4-epimerase
MKILLTGAAGFCGLHVARKLLASGHSVVGLDNLNDYYDPALKRARLRQLNPHVGFRFVEVDISDRMAVDALFATERFDRVVNLAAQPGVRYSLQNPHAYVQANLVGFVNILEGCRHTQVKHLVYASSSSVYGSNRKVPFSEDDSVDHPVSLYAATKKANELMAHTYSHLFGLPTTGLRFFTLYGPWGRPDMSPWLFTSAILEGRPINVFNNGKMRRDFTYVEDVAECTVRIADSIPMARESDDMAALSPAVSSAPYRIYNVGNHQPVELMTFIATLERALGKEAVKNFLPMQAGDLEATFADVQALSEAIGFLPNTSIDEGVDRWVQWYRDYTTGKYN